ncbi:TPA: hypothetical protein KOT36_001664 [Clostridioides difficile]|nr:hypothetical protein [Clostridioides difficile]
MRIKNFFNIFRKKSSKEKHIKVIESLDIIQRIISVKFLDEYILINIILNLDDEIILIHKICNSICRTNYKFLVDNSYICFKCHSIYLTNKLNKNLLLYFDYKYELLEAVTDYNKPVMLMHKSCKKVSYVKPSDVTRDYYCKFCKPINTLPRFKEKVLELTGNEYEVTGRFISASENILMKHTKCNKEFLVTPHEFITGKRCQHCLIKKKTERLQKRIFENFSDEYILTSNYNGFYGEVEILHSKCGFKFKTAPYFLEFKEKCKVCSQEDYLKQLNKNNNLSQEDILKKDIYDFSNKELIVLDMEEKQFSVFEKSSKEVFILEKEAFLNLEDKNNIKYTFINYLLLKNNLNRYVLVSDYVNLLTYTKFLCKECDNLFLAKPIDIINRNKKCPICNEKIHVNA